MYTWWKFKFITWKLKLEMLKHAVTFFCWKIVQPTLPQKKRFILFFCLWIPLIHQVRVTVYYICLIQGTFPYPFIWLTLKLFTLIEFTTIDCVFGFDFSMFIQCIVWIRDEYIFFTYKCLNLLYTIKNDFEEKNTICPCFIF